MTTSVTVGYTEWKPKIVTGTLYYLILPVIVCYSHRFICFPLKNEFRKTFPTLSLAFVRKHFDFKYQWIDTGTCWKFKHFCVPMYTIRFGDLHNTMSNDVNIFNVTCQFYKFGADLDYVYEAILYRFSMKQTGK